MNIACIATAASYLPGVPANATREYKMWALVQWHNRAGICAGYGRVSAREERSAMRRELGDEVAEDGKGVQVEGGGHESGGG